MSRKSMNSSIKNHFKIYFLIESEPHTVSEIKDETGLPDSSVRDALDRFEDLGKVKILSENPKVYAGADYAPLPEEMRKAVLEVEFDDEKFSKAKKGDNVSIDEFKQKVAVNLGINPGTEEFENAFYNMMSGFVTNYGRTDTDIDEEMLNNLKDYVRSLYYSKTQEMKEIDLKEVKKDD